MGAQKNVERAVSIYTEGMMKGVWNKKADESAFPHCVFQSQSHPNYTLTFTKTYLVEVSEGVEKNMYHYFWDPKHGYLCERRILNGKGSLSVEILKSEINDSANQEVQVLERKIEKLLKKNKDLEMQVKSLQYICENQERTLVGTTYRNVKDHSGFQHLGPMQQPVAIPSQQARSPFTPFIQRGAPVSPNGLPIKIPNGAELCYQPSVGYHPANQHQHFQTPPSYAAPQRNHFLHYPRMFEQPLIRSRDDEGAPNRPCHSLAAAPPQMRSARSLISNHSTHPKRNIAEPVPVTSHGISARDF